MSHQPGVPDVPEIDVEAAWERFRSQNALIVDVREPEELDEINIPGVTHIPLGELPSRVASLPHDRELLLICRSGVRSAYATEFLRTSGFDRSLNISGGVIAWAEAELPYVLHGQPVNVDANEDDQG
ncbi:MAG TPA: rhodanese-like domain-containing protein [Nitrolancea sp.]|nr:rhodanese-like domain-containing protein [Nitrolancea sp.]